MSPAQTPKAKTFTAQDRRFLKKHGISGRLATEQIKRFKKGFAFVELIAPCTAGNGVLKLNFHQKQQAEKKFKDRALFKQILKFVPASGAASRMFSFLEDAKPENTAARQKFLKHLSDFAFYDVLSKAVEKNGQSLDALKKTKQLESIVHALLGPQGLNYCKAPKGMILFHREGKKGRTAFEEQLSEALLFSDRHKKVRLHFTLTEAVRSEVKKHLKDAAKNLNQFKFILNDSIQSSSTDCLAVEKNGSIVRDDHGDILLRPAGHGALLNNLNQMKADLIYIKNIDNILPEKKRSESDRWKKILCGVFLETQERVFKAQEIVHRKKMRPDELLSVLKLAEELGGGRGFGRQTLAAFFDRPLRVCGMVPNTGEPGGGPFWIRDKSGNVSAQIVESAEVDSKNKQQEKIWRSSTHFNPVDFVCGTLEFQGKKFNLLDFSDAERGLITKKNYQGREIQAMELPGLWNGGMANWLSVFIEIPAAVFAPVKTALDLLRPEHQPRKKR